VLPYDQIKVRFITSNTDQDGLRLQPDIFSKEMPSPLKERYQVPLNDGTGGFEVRMPCDDMKVADSIQCENFDVYCSDPND